jgi:hypothetical protein
MLWQRFVLALAPYVVTLAGLVLAAFWGSKVLAAKDAQLAAKDEQLAAKEEQLKTVRLMAPDRVVQNIRALHSYYKDEATVTKAKLRDATTQLAAAGSEREVLRAEVEELRERVTIYEFAVASTATSVLGARLFTPASLRELKEDLADGYEPTGTLDEVGTGEDGLPIYQVEGKLMTTAEAQMHLVEKGLEDPETAD